MTTDLPEPKSRKESYLAKAAGMSVTIPEEPESRLEQYLDAIAKGGGGGGGSYSAGNAITIENNTISAAVYPEDYFTKEGATVTGAGSSVTLNSTLAVPLEGLSLHGDSSQAATPSVASPSPVNVVTGTQTVTLSKGQASRNFTVALGSIELCKIGDYQDYIYKEGSDWYLHKEINKFVYDGSSDELWEIQNTGTPQYLYESRNALADHAYIDAGAGGFICSAGVGASIGSDNTTEGARIIVSGNFRIRYGAEMSLSDWESYLSSTPIVLYYVIATATETKITDATLVTQLNALAEANLYNGSTSFATAATSPNLPVILDLEAFTASLAGTLAFGDKPVVTYDDFTGTDGNTPGEAGLVPAPATTDAGKFLKSDGTWATAGGGGGDTVYSTVTTSGSSTGGAVYIGNLDSDQVEQPDPTTTDEHSRYFWALPFLNNTKPGYFSVNIMGANAADYTTVLGREATAPSIGQYGIAVGYGATVRSQYSVALGTNSYIENGFHHSVALGDRAAPTRAGEVNVGQSTGLGFNNTVYRVIGGVHDGQDLHDAATVAQGNTLSTSAPTTSTVGVLGQLWTDTTNMHTYQCTAISGDTYTWTQRW